MSPEENRAVLALSLLAAFADGEKHAREREEIRRVADGFQQSDPVHLATLYQDVLMKRVTLPDVVAQLQSSESKRLAYEMAVCVCDADGALSDAEQRFLADASKALGLDPAASTAYKDEAQAIAFLPISDSEAGTADSAAKAVINDVELDSAIFNAAIINGALELLPESLSTMAIIPLQMKLVYRIGKAHGFELDSGHVKDFLATAGVGLTSQYLEQAGRKLLGGLLGKLGGGLLGGVGKQAVSSSMSFATTYALGHVAKRYYAGGRQLSTQMLKEAYASTMQEAKGLSTRYLPDIQAKAKTLDARSVLSMVRGA
ncbi:MAG: TerB family tellurite resistance protein [Dokdonella sp.]